MKTTIEVPDEVLQRAEVEAARRQTTLNDLIVSGLELVMRSETTDREAAIERLRQGLDLGGKFLTREQSHERR